MSSFSGYGGHVARQHQVDATQARAEEMQKLPDADQPFDAEEYALSVEEQQAAAQAGQDQAAQAEAAEAVRRRLQNAMHPNLVVAEQLYNRGMEQPTGPSPAELQMQQAMQAAQAQQNAQMQANAGLNPALAARMAANQGALMQQGVASQGAILRAAEDAQRRQEQLRALQMSAAIRGASVTAPEQAAMQQGQFNVGQQNQMGAAMMGSQMQQQMQQAQLAYNQWLAMMQQQWAEDQQPGAFEKAMGYILPIAGLGVSAYTGNPMGAASSLSMLAQNASMAPGGGIPAYTPSTMPVYGSNSGNYNFGTSPPPPPPPPPNPYEVRIRNS